MVLVLVFIFFFCVGCEFVAEARAGKAAERLPAPLLSCPVPARSCVPALAC